MLSLITFYDLWLWIYEVLFVQNKPVVEMYVHNSKIPWLIFFNFEILQGLIMSGKSSHTFILKFLIFHYRGMRLYCYVYNIPNKSRGLFVLVIDINLYFFVDEQTPTFTSLVNRGFWEGKETRCRCRNSFAALFLAWSYELLTLHFSSSLT